MEPALESRRSFLDILLKTGLFAWLAAMVLPALAYIWPARAGGGRIQSVSAGPIADFNNTAAKMVQAEGKPIIVVKAAAGQFVAYSAICTHLGCIVKWNSQGKQIECPCHAAVFDLKGEVVSGPPPRALQKYEVFTSGGEVRVKIV